MRALLICLVLVLGGCEITDTMDAVQETPGKMDDMQAQMKAMQDEMNKMRSVVDRQPVFLAFVELYDATWGRDLVPFPYDLVGFAKEFGKYATVEDLVELFYVQTKKLNEVQLIREYDEQGNEIPATKQEIAEFNHDKQRLLKALQSVAGLLPDAKVEQIVEERIKTDDRYRNAALTLLMMRVQFIRDVLIEESLFKEDMTVGGYVDAVEYGRSIEYIGTLPFRNMIKVEITGFDGTDLDIAEALDPGQPLATWKKIRAKTRRGLDASAAEAGTYSSDPAENQRLFIERQRKLNEAIAEADARIQALGGVVP